MKVLAIHGDPRTIRHTEYLLDHFMDSLKTKYMGVEIIRLETQNLMIKACESCDACKTNRIEDCIIKDDMTKIYDVLRKSDIIVFSFPIIWAHMPGKMKSFIDRFNAVKGEPFIEKKRKLAVIATYEGDSINLSGYNDVINTFRLISKEMNFEFIHHLGISVTEDGALKDQEDLEKLNSISRQL